MAWDGLLSMLYFQGRQQIPAGVPLAAPLPRDRAAQPHGYLDINGKYILSPVFTRTSTGRAIKP
jgi:hypothetical protein